MASSSSFVLTAVDVVLRHQSAVAGVLELQPMTTSFLGPPPSLSLRDSAKYSSVRLCDWIWESSCTSAAERTSSWSLTNYLRSDVHYYKWQFERTMEKAAVNGDAPLVEWLLTHFSGYTIPEKAITSAAKQGSVGILQWLFDHDHEKRDAERDWCSLILQSNHFEVMRWMCEHRLHEQRDDPDELDELDFLIGGLLDMGHIELAKSLIPEGGHISDFADTESMHPNVTELLLDCGDLQEGHYFTLQTMPQLAKHGRLDLMKRVVDPLLRRPTNWSLWVAQWQETLELASQRGDVPMVSWLFESSAGCEVCRNFNISSLLFSTAAEHGHVELMEYLKKRDKYFVQCGGKDLVETAIRHGQVEALEWLFMHVSYDTRHDTSTYIEIAAEVGDVDVLEFFYQQDCAESFVPANLKRRRLDTWRMSGRAFDLAASNGQLDVLKWLQSKGYEGCTAQAMDGAASNGHLEVVQWLHCNRTEGCTTDAFDGAAEHGHLDVVKWLYENRLEGGTVIAIEKAVRNGHLQVTTWLLSTYPEYSPTKLEFSLIGDGKFDVLLYLEAKYRHLFTRELIEDVYPRSESIDGHICEWLQEHFPHQF